MAEIKKLTQKDMFNHIIEVCGAYPEIVEFCEGRIALLAKKNTTKDTAKAEVNQAIAEIILTELANMARPVTVTELMTESEVIRNYRLADGGTLTNPRITYILGQLKNDNKVVRTQDKKKALYSVI